MSDMDFQKQVLQGLANLTTSVNHLSTRIDAVETRLGTIENQIDTLETRFDALETRFDALETRFDALEGRMTNIEARITTVETGLTGLREAFDSFVANQESFNEAIWTLSNQSFDQINSIRRDTTPSWQSAARNWNPV